MLIIDRIVSRVGRRVDESSPMVDARLPDGSRINAIIPPLALDGPALSIRRFGKRRSRVDDLVDKDTLTPDMVEFLRADRPRAPQRHRLRRHRLGQDHDAQLSVGVHSRRRAHRHDRGLGRIVAAAAARRAARNAAVQHRRRGRSHAARPGQELPCVCGPTASSSARSAAREVFDMLQAMSTGHDGSIATIHANSPRDMPGPARDDDAAVGLSRFRSARCASRSPPPST